MRTCRLQNCETTPESPISNESQNQPCQPYGIHLKPRLPGFCRVELWNSADMYIPQRFIMKIMQNMQHVKFSVVVDVM